MFAALALASLALGHLGRWLPLGDSLAVLRPQTVIALVLVAVPLALWGWRRLAAVGALAGLLAGMPLAAGILARQGVAGPLVLYQKNVLYAGGDRDRLEADILASGADFVTLEEVSGEGRATLSALIAAYPHRQFCDYEPMGVVLLSRHPFEPGSGACGERDRVARALVILPDGRALWLVALHLRWPFPFGQQEQIDRIADDLGKLEGPVVVAGDFNMVPWGWSVRRIADATRTVRAGPYRSTFQRFAPLAPLVIDHVLLPQGSTGRAETRPEFGSDHRGLVIRFVLP